MSAAFPRVQLHDCGFGAQSVRWTRGVPLLRKTTSPYYISYVGDGNMVPALNAAIKQRWSKDETMLPDEQADIRIAFVPIPMPPFHEWPTSQVPSFSQLERYRAAAQRLLCDRILNVTRRLVRPQHNSQVRSRTFVVPVDWNRDVCAQAGLQPKPADFFGLELVYDKLGLDEPLIAGHQLSLPSLSSFDEDSSSDCDGDE